MIGINCRKALTQALSLCLNFGLLLYSMHKGKMIHREIMAIYPVFLSIGLSDFLLLFILIHFVSGNSRRSAKCCKDRIVKVL
jgi:hypothetical protein